MAAMVGSPVTEKQHAFVRSLQRELRLPGALLDNHTVRRFGKPYGELDRAQVSALIDEMIGWKDLPVELQRAKGQADLPGFG